MLSVRLMLALGAAAACIAAPPADSATPAGQAAAHARRAIKANPDRFEAHNALAFALARRGRETADHAFYEQGELALAESFRLEPGNFEGRRIQAWILLGKHDFAAALKVARELNESMPDDVLTYGLLADAHVELGNYAEAEEAVQWMLDLRAGNIPGLTRAAGLRELFGDPEGAVELLEAAYTRTPPAESEDRAWILVQVARLELSRGKKERADALLGEALKLFPGYHYALAGLARLRTALGRYTDAVDLLRRRYQAAPHPENLYDLAEAMQRAGRRREAKPLWSDFERQATTEMNGVDNCNHELVFFYTDQARKPAKALRVAEIEFARRKDVNTIHAYAWALHANGRHADARRQIEKALEVGIRDPRVFYHAGVIASKLKDREAARGYFEKCLEPHGQPEYAEMARASLRRTSAAN